MNLQLFQSFTLCPKMLTCSRQQTKLYHNIEKRCIIFGAMKSKCISNQVNKQCKREINEHKMNSKIVFICRWEHCMHVICPNEDFKWICMNREKVT